MFIESLLFDATAEIMNILNQLALNIRKKYKVTITKQDCISRINAIKSRVIKLLWVYSKKTERLKINTITLIINNLKLFYLRKSKTKNPVLQKDGVKNSTKYHYQIII